MATWQLNQTVKLSANIQVGGVDTDPGALVFRIRAGPSGDFTTYTYGTDAQVVKESVGDYYVLWLITEEAEHWWEFKNTATGAARGAKWQTFEVEHSRLA